MQQLLCVLSTPNSVLIWMTLCINCTVPWASQVLYQMQRLRDLSVWTLYLTGCSYHLPHRGFVLGVTPVSPPARRCLPRNPWRSFMTSVGSSAIVPSGCFAFLSWSLLIAGLVSPKKYFSGFSFLTLGLFPKRWIPSSLKNFLKVAMALLSFGLWFSCRVFVWDFSYLILWIWNQFQWPWVLIELPQTSVAQVNNDHERKKLDSGFDEPRMSLKLWSVKWDSDL